MRGRCWFLGEESDSRSAKNGLQKTNLGKAEIWRKSVGSTGPADYWGPQFCVPGGGSFGHIHTDGVVFPFLRGPWRPTLGWPQVAAQNYLLGCTGPAGHNDTLGNSLGFPCVHVGFKPSPFLVYVNAKIWKNSMGAELKTTKQTRIPKQNNSFATWGVTPRPSAAAHGTVKSES